MTEANGQAATPTTAPEATVTAINGSNGGDGIKVAGQLSADNRAAIEAKKWLTESGEFDANKAIDGYRNLESEFSKSLRMPGENATADDWSAFYSKLGRPEKATDYALKLDASAVPEGFPYDEKSAVEFRNWAHEAGLNPRQAQLLHDKFVASQATLFTDQVGAAAERAQSAHRDLVGKWGEPESEAYQKNVALLSRAVDALGVKDSLVKAGIISQKGEVLDAPMALAFAKVGQELYAEDTMTATRGSTMNNPWAKATRNFTEMARIRREDPELAARLEREAG